MLDVDEDFYGFDVGVDVEHWLRGQERFADIDALLAQIRADVDRTRALLGHDLFPNAHGGRRAGCQHRAMAEAVRANRARQCELYGAPLGDRVRRLTARLGISQARLARVLGISPAMLSQLVSARRVKIGDPAVLARLRALDRGRAAQVTARNPRAVEKLLADIARMQWHWTAAAGEPRPPRPRSCAGSPSRGGSRRPRPRCDPRSPRWRRCCGRRPAPMGPPRPERRVARP